MKPFAVLLASIVVPWGGFAQTAPVTETPPPPPKPRLVLGSGNSTSTSKSAPATGAKATGTAPKSTTTAGSAEKAPDPKAAAAKGAKKDEPPPKIEGMEIARGAKGFLGLQVVDGSFKLSFYDAKKKPLAPDVSRAVLRWTPTYQKAPEIFILGPGDGKALTVAKTVRPPYNFKLFMSLFVEGVDDPTESFVVDFRQ